MRWFLTNHAANCLIVTPCLYQLKWQKPVKWKAKNNLSQTTWSLFLLKTLKKSTVALLCWIFEAFLKEKIRAHFGATYSCPFTNRRKYKICQRNKGRFITILFNEQTGSYSLLLVVMLTIIILTMIYRWVLTRYFRNTK